MANDCLVTKLKGVVDNDNLDLLGSVRFHTEFTSSTPAGSNDRYITIKIPTGASCYIKALNGGTFDILDDSKQTVTHANVSECTVNYGDSGHSNGWATIRVHDGNFDILVGNKYGEAITFGKLGIAQLPIKLVDGDISKFNYLTRQINAVGDNFIGTYKALPSVTSITIAAPGNNGIYSGFNIDIPSLIACTNLEGLVTRGMKDAVYDMVLVCGNNVNIKNITVAYCPNVTGDIADLAAAQVAAGRTSGNIKTEAIYSKVTINGESFYDVVRSHNAWSAWIVFDSSYTGGYNIVYTQPS